MDNRFASIKAVGFDLDNTLYTETPVMREIVIDKVVEKIFELKPELGSVEKARKVYGEKYKEIGSWSQIFIKDFGILDPAPILLNCFETAGIFNFIERDTVLTNIMQALSKKYFLFIITGSSKQLARAKLQKIGIIPELFSFSFFADDAGYVSKVMPDNFKYFLSQSQYAPHEHVYVGDSLEADIINPKSLGIKTIAVGHSFPEADCCVDTIRTIADLLL